MNFIFHSFDSTKRELICVLFVVVCFFPSSSILTKKASHGSGFLSLLHLPHYGKWQFIRAFFRSLSIVCYLADSAVRTNLSYLKDPI